MTFDIKKVKIITAVPSNHLDKVREVAWSAGAGAIGNYDQCSTAISGTGTFRPNANTNPYIGQPGQTEQTAEIILAVTCDIAQAKSVTTAIRNAHPYEEPVINVIPLVDENDLA